MMMMMMSFCLSPFTNLVLFFYRSRESLRHDNNEKCYVLYNVAFLNADGPTTEPCLSWPEVIIMETKTEEFSITSISGRRGREKKRRKRDRKMGI